MSQWDKLLKRILSLSKDMRFEELKKVLEAYGYEMSNPRSGSSHYTFRKITPTQLQFLSMNQLKRYT